MLRSLIAIIIAVVAGLSVARFVEASTMRGANVSLGSDAALPPDYLVTLILGWLIGAGVASALALFIGRRWAPLGFLAGGTIFFSAMITILTFSLNWFLVVPAALVTAGSSFGVHRLMKPQMAYPQGAAKRDYFSE